MEIKCMMCLHFTCTSYTLCQKFLITSFAIVLIIQMVIYHRNKYDIELPFEPNAQPFPIKINPAFTFDSTKFKYPLTIKQRVKYYLTPKWYSYFAKSMKNTFENNPFDVFVNISLFNTDIENNSKSLLWDEYIIVSQKSLQDHKRENTCNPYCSDSLQILMLPTMKKCKYHNRRKRYVMQFGDQPMKIGSYETRIPVFKKSRFMNAENAMLLKLHSDWHFDFYFEIESNDLPWKEKNSRVLWRGTMTGSRGESRYNVVNKYFKSYAKRDVTNVTIDIAFTEKNQNYELWKNAGFNTDHLLRERISKKQMLQSKYLISIAGNDVATNFGWILYSNSVPFLFRLPMEESGYETEAWAMHGLLQPYMHYIPFTVNNDTDESLLKAYEFCESHSENCSQIAQNGKQWMMQFRDEKREQKIQAIMLVMYCHSVHMI